MANFVLHPSLWEKNPDVQPIETIEGWTSIGFILPPIEEIRTGFTSVIAGVREAPELNDGNILCLGLITDVKLDGNQLAGGSPARVLSYFLSDANPAYIPHALGVMRWGESIEPVGADEAKLNEELGLLTRLVRPIEPGRVR